MRRTPILMAPLLVVAMLATTSDATAAPISTDATFGCDGRAEARFEDDPVGDFPNLYRGGVGDARDLAVQDDGRIVAVGEGDDEASNGAIGIARFNTDGTLDDTFGVGGLVTTDLSVRAWGWAVALQPDGGIVVAGNSFSDYPITVVVARYDTNGALDPSFGSGGIATVATGDLEDVRDVALLPDGSILVLASRFGGGDDRIVLLRFDDTGALDTTFGTNGIVVWQVPGVYGSAAARFGLDSTGRIIVVGSADGGANSRALLVAFDPTGLPDPTFGTDGYVIDALGPAAASFVSDVYVSTDDSIWIGGSVSPTGHPSYDPMYLAAAHYDATGSPVVSFGTAGVATGDAGWGRALVVDDQDRPVIVGEAQAVAAAIADRFTAAGVLDPTFAVGGAPLEVGDERPTIAAATLLTDGRVLVAGGIGHQGGAGFALLSIGPDGAAATPTCPDLSVGLVGGPMIGEGSVSTTAGEQLVTAHVDPGEMRRFAYTITNEGSAGDYFTAFMTGNGRYSMVRQRFEVSARDPDGTNVTNWLDGGGFFVYLEPGTTWTLVVRVGATERARRGRVQRLTLEVRSFTAGTIDRAATRTVVR